jgi:hypothetical protein
MLLLPYWHQPLGGSTSTRLTIVKCYIYVVEINQALLEGLVDIGASMFVMATSVVRELKIMHWVSRHETYKTIFGMITQALGIIIRIPMTKGKVICQIIFLIVDTNSYDLLLGQIFLWKSKLWLMLKRELYRFRTG